MEFREDLQFENLKDSRTVTSVAVGAGLGVADDGTEYDAKDLDHIPSLGLGMGSGTCR